MGATSRTLEITVISCQNIRVTDEAYVVVRAESLKSCTTKTAKDNANNGDSSLLTWNEKFMLELPVHARSITFEVQSNKFKAARPVAVARIAVADFLGGGAVPENCLQVLSYRLRDWDGRRNGVIHFAVRVAEEKSVAAAEPMACRKGAGNLFTGMNVGDNKSNEVVVGVPFWWNYPNII